MYFKYKLIKTFLNFVLIFKLVVNDCGLPAIPYNAHLNKVERVYYDGDTVEYNCQLDDLKLVGNKTRKCVNDRWVGPIPRCVEELNFGTISAIALSDTRNHTFDYSRQSSWFRNAKHAFFADYKSVKCLKSSDMSRPHTWKLHLTKSERHISYMEFLFQNNKKMSSTDARKIIKSAKVNQYRDCVPAIIDVQDPTTRLGLTCFMELDADSMFELWEKDQTQLIEIQFDLDDISICEIDIYKNSFMPYNRCGSADIVLHSTMEFIKSGTKFSGGSYYRYTCDKGFELEGKDTVRCGLNNNWLDEFPYCRPIATCSFPPSVHQSISVDINFEHLYGSEDNVSAVIGSIVSYDCIGDDNRTIMIGDSVRVCGSDGKWSGVDPICIHSSELNADLFKDIGDTNRNDKQMTTFKIFDENVAVNNNTTLSCGIPAMPLFAKPTSGKKFQLFGGQADIRSSYENGTVINYQCESAYRWVYGDVGQRKCVNGKWVGKVGKCAINWGNKIKLNTINIFDWKKGKWVDTHAVIDTNSTNVHLDPHFAYRRDADKDGECAKFSVENKHRWMLQLNQSVMVTYFTVMLHPGGFFGDKHKIDDPKILSDSPVTAMLGRRSCVLTSAWDYTHSKIGTYFFFACDMEDKRITSLDSGFQISLDIDPNRFNKKYTARNISLCSLAVMVAKDDCGQPDIPLHSSVFQNPNTREWKFTCDPGYQLIGQPSVTCGKNGRWSGDFPMCRKNRLCPMADVNTQVLTRMRINYKNLIKIDGNDVAAIDSLANYSCITRKDKYRILIGSQLRICSRSGKWSGSDPYCMNPKNLPNISRSSDTRSVTSVFAVVFTVIIAMFLVVGLVWYAFNKGFLGVPTIRLPSIPKINIQRKNDTMETPKDINSNVNSIENPIPMPMETPKQPKQKTTKINDNLFSFSNGKERLVESDDEN